MEEKIWFKKKQRVIVLFPIFLLVLKAWKLILYICTFYTRLDFNVLGNKINLVFYKFDEFSILHLNN